MTQTLAASARDSAHEVKITRWVAMVAGLLGFVLSVLTPLLPVVQTTAVLNWPQGGELNNVSAPLISQTPVSMTARLTLVAAGASSVVAPATRLRRWRVAADFGTADAISRDQG